MDRDDAVQPQSTRARGARRGGSRGRRRRRARVQHDRSLRQPVAGDTGHACLVDLARGDRRLDRADGARARFRRSRLPRRLRQDRACGVDGARTRRQAGCRPLQRPDAGGAAWQPRRDDPGRLGSGGRRRARADPSGGARRARALRLSGSRNVRGPLHCEHNGGGARLPRHHAVGGRAHPGRRARREGRCRGPCRHARSLAAGHVAARSSTGAPS